MGERGRTEKRELNSKWNDFERGKTSEIVIHAIDLGRLKAVKLFKHGMDDWKVNFVEIETAGSKDRFNFSDQKITKEGVSAKKC